MEPQAPANTIETNTNQPQPSVPATWPGAFGIYKQARTATLVNGWTLLGMVLVSILISAPVNIASKDNSLGTATLVASLIVVLLSFWLQLAMTYVLLAGGRGQKLGFGQALRKGLKVYVNGLVAYFLSRLLVVLSLVALVVPFFFVMPRLALVLYYLIDKNLGPIEAIKASWNGTKGHAGKVWGVIAVEILFGVLMLVLVGIYLSFMYLTATALLYLFVTSHQALSIAKAETTETPVTPAA